MRPYLVQMDSQLLKLKYTQPYYTKPVEPIEKWGDPPPLSRPGLESPTAPNQYNLLRNEETLPHELSWSVQSPTTTNQYNLSRNMEAFLLIGLKCTEPYYTLPVEPIEKWGHT